MDFNIIILSLLPAIIYILVIYITVPYKKINLKTSFLFLMFGFFSVFLLKTIWFIFPSTTTVAFNMANPYIDPFRYYHYFYFIQVALFEELCKLIIFLIVNYIRKKVTQVNDHPIATMFYVTMVSLGFAVIENLQYGINLGSDVLYFRAITAVIGHMVFGLFMGYWISLGKIGVRLYDRSLFDIVINKRKKIRNIVFTIIGLISATILHGIYDLHLQMNKVGGITGIYILLTFSLIGAYWCFKNLIKFHKRKQKHLINK